MIRRRRYEISILADKIVEGSRLLTRSRVLTRVQAAVPSELLRHAGCVSQVYETPLPMSDFRERPFFSVSQFCLTRRNEMCRRETERTSSALTVFLNTRGVSSNRLVPKHFVRNAFLNYYCLSRVILVSMLFVFHSRAFAYRFSIPGDRYIPMLIRTERLTRREERISREIDEPRRAEYGVFEDDSVRLRRQRRGIN